MTLTLIILFFASIWAGAQNALAGGGSFITLPSLMLTGMDARAANITSTRRAVSGQVVTGFTGRSDADSAAGALVRGAVRHQPGRRRDRRGDTAGDPAVVFRAAGALARVVRHRAVRLGQLLPQAAEAGRRPSAAVGRGDGRSSSSPSMAAISAAASAS